MTQLPVRPRPGTLEPLLGYMYRLAKENGYDKPQELWNILSDGCENHEAVMLVALKADVLPEFGAPKPRWLNLNVDHRGIQPYNFNHYYLRLCRKCLADSPEFRPFWSLNFAVVCTKHKLWLTPFQSFKDPASKAQLGGKVPRHVLALSRLLETSFVTGRPAQDSTLSVIDHPISAPQTIKLIRTLVFLCNDQYAEKAGKITKAFILENARFQVERAAEILEEWPSKFWKKLDEMMDAAPNSMSIKRVFGRLYNVLYKELDEPEFLFLRKAFEGFLADFWRGEISGRHRRLNRYLIESQQRISTARAGREFGISERALKEMFKNGELSKKKTERVGRREFATFDLEELKSAIECKPKFLDLQTASKQLGINKWRLRELITSGHLLAVASPAETSEKRWKIQKSVVSGLVMKLSAMTTALTDARPQITLAHVLKFWRLDAQEWGNLFQSLMDGKILFRCADPFSFATIEMFEDEVRSWLTERRSYTMNVPMHISTAAKFLGVKQQVMYQLVANGFVPALLHVIRGHYYRGVNIRDLDRFREKYVSLAELARDEGTSPSHMMKKILVSPVTGPSIDGCRQYFYLRASLCSRNKGD
ncbi:hypothetical protein EJD96_00315 [Herbaspirillum seropedicae]|uniref:TniQ family protein n=1 Tax=Herbaspirillum seropedicae TaxID=964 RepID=UPI001121E59B|nr:TniQ family protein [Herbaspirillum seropedicae]QDD62694.1 hypothetical protein EJD96_00315 [Herbaspirillum seropedicae]